MLLSEYIKLNASAKAKADLWVQHNSTNPQLFEKTEVPTVTDIINYQKNVALYYKHKNLSPAMEKLNRDLRQQNETAVSAIEPFIKKLEEYTTDLKFTSASAEMIKMNERTIQATYNSIIEQWKSLIAKIQTYSNYQQIDYAIQGFNRVIDRFTRQISTIGNLDLSASEWQTYSFQLTWMANVIKGFALEAEGVEFFQNVVPSDIKVVQTGDVKVPLTLGDRTSIVSMKEDITSLVDKNLLIEYKIGKEGKVIKTPLKEFIENVKTQQESIILTEQGYKNLQKQIVAAVTAKATRSSYITLASSMSIAKLEKYTDKAAGGSWAVKQRLWSLKHLKDLYTSTKAIYVAHEDYGLLFNYVLSKSLVDIIGKNNTFILTREGFENTYEFLTRQLNAGNYIQSAASPNVSLTKASNIRLRFR